MCRTTLLNRVVELKVAAQALTSVGLVSAGPASVVVQFLCIMIFAA